MALRYLVMRANASVPRRLEMDSELAVGGVMAGLIDNAVSMTRE